MNGIRGKLSSSQMILLGFALVIAAGSLLLMLPIATRDGRGAPFFDALFTTTSAVCVTGLVVCDTAAYWSRFGQAVILTLIQIGGMGVVTVAVAFSVLSGRKIGLKERSIMQDAISARRMGGIIRMTGFIIRMTILLEIAGALLMFPAFFREFGVWKGAWYALFHSVSAFCNAGFDLMGTVEPYSSLTAFKTDPFINVSVMLLILIGGIGFTTWDDIKSNGYHVRKYQMQSKVILSFSLSLILFPALYFFFFEYGGCEPGERVWLSVFQAIAPRTAGFNTADLGAMSETGQALMIVLMLIGGAPGSTAGGLKLTTAALLLATASAVLRGRSEVCLFHRGVENDIIHNAVALLMMYLLLFVTGGLVISRLEGLPLLTCLFETASAIATVGLTLSVTPTLGTVSRMILIALMYIGRVGGLTLIFATFTKKRKGAASRFPQEKLAVG